MVSSRRFITFLEKFFKLSTKQTDTNTLAPVNISDLSKLESSKPIATQRLSRNISRIKLALSLEKKPVYPREYVKKMSVIYILTFIGIIFPVVYDKVIN